MAPGLASSLGKSKKMNHNKKHTKFMSIQKKLILAFKLLCFYGADPVSAEMALTIIHRLRLKKKMEIASAVYLAAQWGSQAGRGDYLAKQLFADYLGFNSLPHSKDMKKFGQTQLELFAKLNFNVRKFGETSLELEKQTEETNLKFTKHCLALFFFEPNANPAKRARWAAKNKILQYSHLTHYNEVLTLSGKLVAHYLKRSKMEEEFCKTNILKNLGF